MKNHEGLVDSGHRRPGVLRTLMAGFCLMLALTGCAPQLVAAHDVASENEILACARSVDRFWAGLLDTDPKERRYAAFKGQYNAIEADLRVLVLRQETRPKNEETLWQAKLILQLWQNDKASHKKKDDFSDYLGERHRKQFFEAFAAMVKGEKAKDLGTKDTAGGE